MKNLYPNLTVTGSTEPRKITRQNMDNVFSMLINLAMLEVHSTNAAFASVLTITYNRITVLFNEDPELCLRTLKLYQKWFTEYLRGKKLANPGVKAWMWDGPNHCPIMLTDLILFMDPLTFGSAEFLSYARISFALLGLSRVMVIPGKPSTATITSPGVEIDKKTIWYPKDICQLLGNLGITPVTFKDRYRHECDAFKYRVLNSAGPNGKATWTAHSDAKAWMKNQHLFEYLTKVLSYGKMDSMLSDMINCVKIDSVDERKIDDIVISRLHSFDEWGGKVRTVAVVDYWTQMALTPLHRTINYFLAKLDMDGTFNQDKMASDVCSETLLDTNVINSYDLTAATDRIPIDLQVDILTALTGSADFALSWKGLLVDRDYIQSDGTAIRYAVGQPMGALSSFAMLALTHHVILQHAARENKLGAFTSYRVLGDDMTVWNADVATTYTIMMSQFGVPINFTKSLTHGKGYRVAAEICKRVFISGFEISTIPVKLLAKLARDYSLAPVVQDHLASRGWTWTTNSLLAFFQTVINSDALNELMILNCLPSDVSGIKNPVSMKPAPLAEPAGWYPQSVSKDLHKIDRAFTFTAAVECLKRLDALLRSTLAVGATVSDIYGTYADSPVDVKTLWSILGIPTDVPASIVKDLIKDIKSFSPSHPIVKASEAEIQRITELVAGLINHDVNMYNKARNGLLDVMRNALVDVWLDRDAAIAAGTRTILTKSMTNHKLAIKRGTMITDPKTNIKSDNLDMMKLEYSINLASINRNWIVRYGIKYGVQVNSVQSRITPLAVSLDTTSATLLQNLSMDFTSSDKAS